ncbi:MAG: DUF3422 domain-containing protein [Aquimonas sp.]|nr:DUF3422 domain-containing protein [Aquimonas sp.]
MSAWNLPSAHPARHVLNDEVHARPPLPLSAGDQLHYVALLMDTEDRARETEALAACMVRMGEPVPTRMPSHWVAETQADGRRLRLKYERHGEFSSWWVYSPAPEPDARHRDVETLLGERGFEALPGRLMVAIHIDTQPSRVAPDLRAAAERLQSGQPVGSDVGGGDGRVYTGFRIDRRGWTRMLLHNESMGECQAGRYVQRLVEIESYRMMALLSLPIAQAVLPQLEGDERELAAIAEELAGAAAGVDTASDLGLLRRLSALAGRVEGLIAAHGVRFTAAEAYGELVAHRLEELKERPLAGVQSLREFMDRRLTPALRTCQWTARRLHELSQRIARQSQLLRARVEVELERQNQSLLASMDRRAQLQLRLQQTVEGLSVVAITYYAVGLVSLGLKAASDAGVAVQPTFWTGVAVLPILLLVTLGLKRVRHRMRH